MSDDQKTVSKDLENKLAAVVGSSGTVSGVYGGFRVLVKEENKFPFVDVFRLLLEANYDVTVEQENGELVIETV